MTARNKRVAQVKETVEVCRTGSPPAMSEFDGIMRRARQQARASGMKPGDIAKAVAKARGKE
jgi:hypothetical protein